MGNFCSESRAHKLDCEYYMADGGEVPQSDLSGMEVPLEDLPQEAVSGMEVPESDIPSDGKYSSTEQKIKTGLEGIAHGIAGPLATYAETEFLGVKPEDIKGRAEANPLIRGGTEAAALGVGLLTGFGEAGLIAKGAGAVAKAANLSKVGSLAIKGMVEGASFAGSDEITKAMLGGVGSNPEAPASAALLHVGAAGLMGSLAGGVFGLGEGMIGKGMKGLGAPETVSKIEKLLAKVGESPDPAKMLGISKLLKTQTDLISYPLVGAIATKTGIPPGILYSAIQGKIGSYLDKAVGKANPYITDAVIKSIMTNELSGLPNAVHYAMQVAKGVKKASSGVGSLFTAGASQIAPPVSDAARKQLKEFIEGGQVENQLQNSMRAEPYGFANGGEISTGNDDFSKVFPEQNIILNAAKGRISGYLNSIRPMKNQPKLAFDKEIPDVEKGRSYDRAIDLAISPLSILDKINSGNMTPEHMEHFKGLFPDVHKYLSSEMTKKIIEAQMKGEAPPYKKRQAMSMFLGADLDGTFTPQNIAAIQGLYVAKSAQQQAPKTQKSSSAVAKAPTSYLTDSQAREKRQQQAKA